MNENPTEVHDRPWLYAVRDQSFESSDSTGKWLAFFSPQFVDEWWEKIEAATLAGDLGPVSKVSTMYPTQHDRRRKVICVYVCDIDDMDDVMAIREKLRELGITWLIHYKTDLMSASGIRGSLFSA